MFVCVCVGVPVSSRVSAKIQQLVNTLKRPKRKPLREFFVEDFEELLEGLYIFLSFCVKFLKSDVNIVNINVIYSLKRYIIWQDPFLNFHSLLHSAEKLDPDIFVPDLSRHKFDF